MIAEKVRKDSKLSAFMQIHKYVCVYFELEASGFGLWSLASALSTRNTLPMMSTIESICHHENLS